MENIWSGCMTCIICAGAALQFGFGWVGTVFIVVALILFGIALAMYLGGSK